MSLSTRVIAGLGAVVVIGAGTLGGSIAYASGQKAPIKSSATITIGRSSTQLEPTCYNGGAPLTDAQTTACIASSKDTAKLPKLSIKSTDRMGVGVDTVTGDHGWRAYTNGGASAQTPATVANFQKNSTFSGLMPAVNVLTQTRSTLLTVIGFDPKTATSQTPASWPSGSST